MPKVNSMRLLDRRRIPYEVYRFSPDIHSAAGVAEATGLPLDEVYKTVVLTRQSGQAILVVVPGGARVDVKKVRGALGEKKVTVASQRDAEATTGLQVGGISALALLHKRMDVFVDESALRHERILVSAGKRGINLRLSPQDLIRVVGARVIDATSR